MVSCDQIRDDEDDNYIFSQRNVDKFNAIFEDPSDFLCPAPGQQIVIGGTFHEQSFEYLKVEINGCDYED